MALRPRRRIPDGLTDRPKESARAELRRRRLLAALDGDEQLRTDALAALMWAHDGVQAKSPERASNLLKLAKLWELPT